MTPYQKINTWLGWIIFGIASLVYILTLEPTVSFWDCGEYIATAYKLQVGHPPGAPLFQMIGRFFSLFAFGDTSQVAFMVNLMSALSSSFTILFLFWSLTMLAKKLATRNGELTKEKQIVVFGSAVVGALAYTFSDSFWFSATEGEVYAMSSFFTALVFWAILKWEQNADEPHNMRWIILIAYLMGLSIGVHLLNLLAIPAIAFVYYFKKYKNTSWKGMLVTFIISILVLGLVQNGIIPWIVQLAGRFELFFVNAIGMPFNSGTIIYFIVLISGIVATIIYSRRKQKVLLNTITWALVFILIGYSSFFMLIIRSNANTPIDENNPEDAISLLSYLNREQYGDWPILYGQYFNAPIADREDGNPVYRKDVEKGKYVVINENIDAKPVYSKEFSTLFPRMWNNTEQRYANDYKKWSDFKGVSTTTTDEYGEKRTLKKPTFQENLRYFFRYQIGHMYVRYFMWNFSGRQNDIQGRVERRNGNWITGITFLDEARLGPVHKAPESLQSKAENKFYMLPFLLGLLGLIYQFRKDYKNAWVVTLLFVMTGLAILVYLNQHSPQPRERDYAYAASFYAYAIWIGLGVYALFDFASKKLKGSWVSWASVALPLVLVPGIMAAEGWDDHDRSGRNSALMMASNYLNSCEPNAILFTNGDNDTFPLWYAQEVEGIRTDVRVVNLSLLNTDWYIDQMSRKAYDSDRVPFTLPPDQYKDGTRNFTYFFENENITGHVELEELFQIIKTSPDRLNMKTRFGPIDYFPTKKVKITVDSAAVIQTGTLKASEAGLMVDEIRWTLPGSGITKNHLMVLDLIAHNNWKRPVYFATTTGISSYIGLSDYFQAEGLAYRLVPIRTKNTDRQLGRVETDKMYDHLMNKFQFGSMSDPDIYLDETHVRMAQNLRGLYGRLATALIEQGEFDKAREVMDRIVTALPNETMPFNYYTLPVAKGYLDIGDEEKARELFDIIIYKLDRELEFYNLFEGKHDEKYAFEIKQNLSMLQMIIQLAKKEKLDNTADYADEVFVRYFQRFSTNSGF